MKDIPKNQQDARNGFIKIVLKETHKDRNKKNNKINNQKINAGIFSI